MNKALLERRTKMLRLSFTGAPLRDIIDSLSKEYEVKEKLLYLDWERRDNWIPQIVQLNDPTLLHRLLEGAKAILPKAWLLLEDTENDFVKLGALKLIKDTNIQMLEILQSVGAVEKKPLQVDQRVLVIKGQWWQPQRAEPKSPPIPAS